MALFHKVYRISRLPLLLALAVVLPLLVKNPYHLHVANIAMIYSIMTLSLNILSGCTGLMSVGHIAFYGIGAYTSAIFTTSLGFPVGVGILMAGVFSAVGSLVLGLPTMRLRGI